MEWASWSACTATCMAVNEVGPVIVTTFPKSANSVSVVHLKLNSVPLVSVKYGPVGNHGVSASVKSAKSVVMDHDHVFVDALVSLASPAVEETQSKKAFVVLVNVSGVSGARHQSVKQSNPAVVSDRQLIHDLATEAQVLVLVTRPRRKCVNWKPVLVSASGVSGRPALLHAD